MVWCLIECYFLVELCYFFSEQHFFNSEPSVCVDIEHLDQIFAMSLPPTSTGVSSSVGDALHIDLNADQDAINLTNLGYKQEMKRNFSLFSVLSMAFTLTNSWFGISAAMVTGISSGGPVLLVYGIILVALVTSCAAISLSELASAMPVAGGQYFWANELAPKKYANFASYLTGWFAWAGSIFTTSSVTLAMGTAVMGLYQATHEDLCVLMHSTSREFDMLTLE